MFKHCFALVDYVNEMQMCINNLMIDLPIIRSYVAQYLTSFTKFTSNLAHMKLVYFEHWNVLCPLISQACFVKIMK
jgi:hypothetical protein